MSFEYQDTFSDYETPKKISIVLKVAAWILLILNIGAGIYLWLTFETILYAAGGVLAGAVIFLSLYFYSSCLDLLMQIRDNTKK